MSSHFFIPPFTLIWRADSICKQLRPQTFDRALDVLESAEKKSRNKKADFFDLLVSTWCIATSLSLQEITVHKKTIVTLIINLVYAGFYVKWWQTVAAIKKQ